MVDIILEIIRAIFVGVIIYALSFNNPQKLARNHSGWLFINYGFALIFLGMVVDITDNFPQLNFLVIVGDTPLEAFIEKFIGYLLGFGLLAFGLWKWIPSIEEIEKNKIDIEESHKKLESAIAQIRTLKGILPICSHCKKIRDDDGYWNQVEKIINEQTEAELSHGICPACLEKHYKDELK